MQKTSFPGIFEYLKLILGYFLVDGLMSSSVNFSSMFLREVACFAFDASDEYYFEVKKKFLDCGYKIVPTGYLNGVYQRTEDITW